MIDCTTPEPIKDLVFACQAFLFWFDEYKTEGEWTALNKENTFRERIRELVPECLKLIKHDAQLLDCE
jgi:hypothetical protein